MKKFIKFFYEISGFFIVMALYYLWIRLVIVILEPLGFFNFSDKLINIFGQNILGLLSAIPLTLFIGFPFYLPLIIYFFYYKNK